MRGARPVFAFSRRADRS